jgi:3-deoxy-manno-octulosonate cytidylyltransferase (CMP-KDO synthetase)
MGSSRFPGKPLAKLLGKPMVEHCYTRTNTCSDLSGTYVATCNQEIVEHIEGIGGQAIMTSDKHERATDRTAEAMLTIEKNTHSKVDVVVMVQGDEPMVTPEMIAETIKPFQEDPACKIVNLVAPIIHQEEFYCPNKVKVVKDLHDNALYYSREAIPSEKKSDVEKPALFKQIGIIAFTRDFLLQFNEWEETPLEKIESIDMLRVLENGEKIKLAFYEKDIGCVDTLEDLKAVEKKMYQENTLLTAPL